MEAVLAKAKGLVNTVDDSKRTKIIDTLRDLQYSLESPYDTWQRFSGLNLQLAGARLGIDLGIFNALASSEKLLDLETLAKTTNAAPELLARILRYLASVGMLKETNKDEFAANNITKVLAHPGYQGTIHHYFDNLGPAFQMLPDFLAERKYQNMTDYHQTAIQKAYTMDVSAFIWLSHQPQRLGWFRQFMTVYSAGLPDWLSVFPVEKEVSSWSARPEKAVFVNLGGGHGHQCKAFKSKYPNLPGRVILQDLPQNLERVQPIPGVEAIAQNTLEPQVVKCAKFYYMRKVLFDCPDDKCRVILAHCIAAMDADSRILIDEMVLPNEGVSWQATQRDLTMLASHGSKERTIEQWYALMDRAGLKIVEIYTYEPLLHDSVIVAVPK